MKPAPFDYFAPATVEEAVALLEQNGEEAKLLAGGQSLVPLLNFRLVRPKVLIDINGIGGLSYLKEDNGRLRIGALTRHRMLRKIGKQHDRNAMDRHGSQSDNNSGGITKIGKAAIGQVRAPKRIDHRQGCEG